MRHGRLALVVAGSVALLLVALGYRHLEGQPDLPRSNAPAGAPAPVSGPTAAAAHSKPPPSTPVLLDTILSRTASAVPAAAPVWDLCGIGRLPRPPGATASGSALFTELPAHLGAEPTAVALEKLVTALDAGNSRWKAAAVMLRGTDAEGRSALPALAALAAASADPVPASWVLMRCGYRNRNRCTPQDAQRWADLEPDNLAAWLRVLEQEPARTADVMQRAPQTRRFDLHQGELLETVLQAMPPELLPYVQLQVWVYVVGVEAAIGSPDLQALSAHCRPPPEPGSERQRDCAAIAQVLLASTDNLLGRGLGIRIAERSGTPKAQTDLWRAEMNAWRRSAALTGDDQQPLSCDAVARNQAWLQLRTRLGELGAMKALHEQALAASAPR